MQLVFDYRDAKNFSLIFTCLIIIWEKIYLKFTQNVQIKFKFIGIVL